MVGPRARGSGVIARKRFTEGRERALDRAAAPHGSGAGRLQAASAPELRPAPSLRGPHSDPDGLAARPPVAARTIEHPRTCGAATQAAPSVIKTPFGQHIGVPPDHALSATMAISGLSRLVLHVTDINMMKAFVHRDPPRPDQRRMRRARLVGHLPVGMKCREMERYVGPQFPHHPAGEVAQLIVSIVFAGNKERGDLDPAPRRHRPQGAVGSDH